MQLPLVVGEPRLRWRGASRRFGAAVVSAVLGLNPALAAAQAGAAAPAGGAPPDAATTIENEKAACATAFEAAQRLRNETRYLAANEQVLKCANPKCGDAIFNECSKMYTELQDAIPSVVLAARDASGAELVNVQVTIDGTPLTDQLDGRPIQIDPGNHTFVFTYQEAPPVEHRLLIRAGEKFRQVQVTLGAGAAPAAATPVVPPSAAASTSTISLEPEPKRVPVMSWVLGGVGVAALGGFVVLRVIGSTDYDTLKKGCAPDCPDSDVDKVKQKYTLSYVALGVGAASLVGAGIIYLAQPNKHTSESSASLILQPIPGGAAGGFVGRF